MNATSLTVMALTIDCADPAALAEFWGKVLDRPVSPGATLENAQLTATDPERGPRLFFQRVPEPKTVKNRLHLDMVTEHYETEIERLTGLGAKSLDKVEVPGARWTTFADPEGNEFDLLTFQGSE
ncbi:glyoxalase/bleomycin resistance/dioxygenase family protein [Nocardia sp. NEAU-G5]|uniref:Glyoxalase/bleomycin resistance/dioxygenase family protein n=1 Tax=Nocardia albiluteola TaxID=2842303 RepID=A0ABS6B5H9_9NOCA|nr:VOC family protein [Nocardia albiluteola]MBU3062597.1 glyoxalase/bleomycin resistance/dioxygenase family protein [Nocardia albiluteola]MBU3065569.1 glyoxalase/bleomycin resistance/dioxygenase family protein [Nocardia albiluteola]